jgi:ABC-type phosphate transport system substrate-binding protein
VVQAVANDKFGIGYSGIGYATADVRADECGELLSTYFAGLR